VSTIAKFHSSDEWRRGAIVRIVMQNFVTYTLCEVCPGPRLNLVVGPNGIGKSTLVCALALGLAGSPTLLGRGKEVSDYIRHGHNTATLEIELYNGGPIRGPLLGVDDRAFSSLSFSSPSPSLLPPSSTHPHCDHTHNKQKKKRTDSFKQTEKSENDDDDDDDGNDNDNDKDDDTLPSNDRHQERKRKRPKNGPSEDEEKTTSKTKRRHTTRTDEEEEEEGEEENNDADKDENEEKREKMQQNSPIKLPANCNIVIRRVIRRDNTSSWWLNGKACTKKDILHVMHDLNVQVENLCQFLPQDKVASFAALDARELLKETELAVGGESLLTKHTQLIQLKNDTKNITQQYKQRQELLEDLKRKNQMLERDVLRFREREKCLKEVAQLELKRPWLLFELQRQTALALNNQLKEAKNELARYEEEQEPLQRLITYFVDHFQSFLLHSQHLSHITSYQHTQYNASMKLILFL
jgi:hypothetical protein